MRSGLCLLAALAWALAGGCGPTSDGGTDYWIDDAGRYHPKDGGAPTHCDQQHPQDCDYDGDGFTPAQGDCDDNDPTRYPGAPECNANGNGDGIDNNCNQRTDEGCLDTDEDQDGYTVGQGDCNDMDPLVNPGAYEVAGNGKDDNCDGKTDEVIDCDCSTTMTPGDVNSYLAALELCASLVENPALNGDARSRTILTEFGVYKPRVPTSCQMVMLSTGIAGGKTPQMGTQLKTNPYPQNPAKYPENPGYQYEPDQVFDYSEFRVTVRVPTNAHSFSFDFVFMTAEYPEWSCTEYNDTFVAILKSQAFNGNISFDAAHNTIQLNSALFIETDPAQLAGTGFDALNFSCASDGGRSGCTMPPAYPGQCPTGGSTGWLTTTSPVTPGETIDLAFGIFDEGDGILDSTVLLDNFRWEVQGSTGPCTNPDGCLQ
ncbi:MAG TPA: MopE-related protein [Polyangia bacterium]|jgi:hypothetical protein